MFPIRELQAVVKPVSPMKFLIVHIRNALCLVSDGSGSGSGNDGGTWVLFNSMGLTSFGPSTWLRMCVKAAHARAWRK